MRALALLGVFAIAKIAVLVGRPIQPSVWTPIAYFWQDALAALIFGLVDGAIGRRWLGWIMYGTAVIYVAINVAVERVLSSPLTWPMIGAARGALSDSIRYHATPANLALMSLVAAAGLGLPLLLGLLRLPRLRVTAPALLILPGLLIVGLGPLASSHVETIGLDRNPIVALATTALPRLDTAGAGAEIPDASRLSPFGSGPASDGLSPWRGAAAGRNVVLILLESAGAQYLHPYGASSDPMPNLSELAERAMVFENAYAVYPESIKGLFSVICSRYPAMDTETENYARITTSALASVLKSAGYQTALFHSGRFMYLGMEAVVENRGYDVLEDAGAIGGNRESSFGVDEPSTVRRALAWIDSLPRDDRFFLTYLPIAGHHPYETPEHGPFPERQDSDRYLNALHYSDASLGLLFQGLRDRHLDQNTLLVIFGDHAEAFGQHQGNYAHSLFLYEENIHVPYLIAMPGLIAQQVRVSEPISLVDTAPTVLDLLGLNWPGDYEGRSTLDNRPAMALFYTDYSLSMVGLRDGCWKYMYELDSGRSKLFDLSQDAAETKDLSGLQPSRVAAYHSLLMRWCAGQKALVLRDIRKAPNLPGHSSTRLHPLAPDQRKLRKVRHSS